MTLPWELHPDLSEDRLHFMADLVRDVREQAAADQDSDKGDGGWGLGCRTHERTMYAIARACERKDWLRIVESSGLHLVFAIGSVPVRCYRGSPDRPPDHYLQRSLTEVVQYQLAFRFLDESTAGDTGWFWRLAVETDAFGRVRRVVFFQTNASGETRNAWPVVFVTGADGLTDPAQIKAPAVDLPRAAVSPRRRRRAVCDDEEEESGNGGR